MAQTWDSRRLRHERAMDARFTREQRTLAQRVAAILTRHASARTEDGAPIVPDTRRQRDALKTDIWRNVLKPYYIGYGEDAFDGATPRSPYAQLLFDGIEGATRIQAERQAALLRQVVRDPVVIDWLTDARAPEPVTEQRVYDPFHQFVDPNGYRLSDRVWRTSISVRSRVDLLLDYHIPRGTSAVEVARLMEEFLTPGAGTLRTRTPYGREGSYAARRLARTEISAAAGRATLNAAEANPFVEQMRWSLSRSHRCCDICDDYAQGGPNGDGVYPLGQTPRYPAHPHCMCTLSPVPTGSTRDLALQLRDRIRQQTAEARILRGILNPQWLTAAILSGALNDLLARLGIRSRRERTELEEMAA